MLNGKLFLLSWLLLSGAAFGQGNRAIGVTADVQGLVTMSLGTNVSTVADKLPVIEGSQFVTSSTGTVTLKFDNGCSIKLEPNRSLLVDNSKPCAALIAAVQTVGTATAGGGAIGPLGAAIFMGFGIAAVNSVSSTRGTAAGGGDGGGGGGGGGGVIPNLPPSNQ